MGDMVPKWMDTLMSAFFRKEEATRLPVLTYAVRADRLMPKKGSKRKGKRSGEMRDNKATSKRRSDYDYTRARMLFDSEKSATSGDATDKFMLARNLKRRGSRSKPPATSRRDDTFLNRLHASRENKRDARGSKKPTAPTGFEFDRPRTPGPRRQMPFSSANHVVDFETDPTSYTENNNQQGEDDEGVCDEEEVLRFDANKRRGGKVVRRDAGESTKPNNKKDKSCSFYVSGAAGANVGGNRKKESNKRR